MQARFQSIEHRLTLNVIIYSVLIGLLFSGAQISYDYLRDSDRYERETLQLLERQSSAVALALYNYDEDALNTILTAMLLNQGIVASSVVEEKTSFEVQVGLSGEVLHDTTIYISYPVALYEPQEYSQRKALIGFLTVWADARLVKAGFQHRAGVTLLLDLLRNIVLALVLVLVFRVRLTGPIKRLTNRILSIEPHSSISVALSVEDSLKQTELDDLASKMSRLLSNMGEAIRHRELAENRARQLNEELEEKVRARTQALFDSNNQLKNSLEELKNTQSLLVQAQQMATLGQLAAGMAHEVNNPSAVVSSNLESMAQQLNTLLTMESLPDGARTNLQELQELLKSSQQGISQIHHTVSDLRSLTIEKQEQQQKFELSILLEKLLKDMSVQVPHDVSLLSDIEPDVAVEGHQDQIYLALLKVFEHSLTGIVGTGLLELSLKCQQDEAVIRIQNTGQGISEESLTALNDSFSRPTLEQSPSIGLLMAHNAIVNYHGSLTVTSHLGQGTCITIRLPLALSTVTTNQ